MNPRNYIQKLLHPDGRVEEYPPTGETYTLEEMQSAVGGYIEIVRLKHGILMVVNEEGKLQQLPHNEIATGIWQSAGLPRDWIAGPALVCAPQDID